MNGKISSNVSVLDLNKVSWMYNFNFVKEKKYFKFEEEQLYKCFCS